MCEQMANEACYFEELMKPAILRIYPTIVSHSSSVMTFLTISALQEGNGFSFQVISVHL